MVPKSTDVYPKIQVIKQENGAKHNRKKKIIIKSVDKREKMNVTATAFHFLFDSPVT